MFKLILISSIFFYSLTICESKNINFFKQFTKQEEACTISLMNNKSCECNPSGSQSKNWIYFDEKIDKKFGPDTHNYNFFQMSSIISEASPDGFVLISDRFECPGNVDECEMITAESNLFSVTSTYQEISSISLAGWNNLLQRSTLPPTLKSSYKCILQANQTGYLAIRPLMEKVLGWTYTYSCSTSACLPRSHPCNSCPRIFKSLQSNCRWLGKAPKVDEKDGTIIGDRVCVVAGNEKEALLKLNNFNAEDLMVYLPIKIETQVN